MVSFNTSNLITHLRMKHVNEQKEFEAAATASDRKGDGPQQQTLVSSLQRKDQWDEKSEAARKMSEKIIEMTVLCNLPLSFVDNVGFRLFMAHAVPKYKVPSCKYITETTVPALKKKVMEHVSRKLKVLLDSLCIIFFPVSQRFLISAWPSHDNNVFTSKWVCSSLVLEEKKLL